VWPAAILGAWIAIVISGPSPSDEERDELLRACSEAIAGRCTLSNDGEKSRGSPDALAVITHDSNASRARAELGRTGSAWKKRDLTFADADSPKERWRALGLTLATLFGGPAQTPPVRAAEQQKKPPRSAPRDDAPAAAPSGDGFRAARGFIRLGAAISTSPALERGPLRWGAVIRGSVGPLLDVVEPTVAVGYGFRPGSSRGLDVRFLSASAGLSFPYAPAGVFTLRLRLEAAGEWISVSQTEPADSGDRLVAGTLFGLDAAWPARSRFAAFIGGELWMFTGATAIHAGEEKVASVPSRRWATTAGILLELD
jgi:hypothetical protein